MRGGAEWGRRAAQYHEPRVLQQHRHTLWRLLVQEYGEPHRVREFGLVAQSSLEFPADEIDVAGDVGWNGMTKVGHDQRAVSSRSRAAGTLALAGTPPPTQMR